MIYRSYLEAIPNICDRPLSDEYIDEYIDEVLYAMCHDEEDFSLYILDRLQERFPVLSKYPRRFWPGYLPHVICNFTEYQEANNKAVDELTDLVIEYIQNYNFGQLNGERWARKIPPIEKIVIFQMREPLYDFIKDIVELGVFCGFYKRSK